MVRARAARVYNERIPASDSIDKEKKVYAKSLALNNSLETVETAIRAGLRKLRAPKNADAAAPVTV